MSPVGVQRWPALQAGEHVLVGRAGSSIPRPAVSEGDCRCCVTAGRAFLLACLGSPGKLGGEGRTFNSFSGDEKGAC